MGTSDKPSQAYRMAMSWTLKRKRGSKFEWPIQRPQWQQIWMTPKEQDSGCVGARYSDEQKLMGKFKSRISVGTHHIPASNEFYNSQY